MDILKSVLGAALGGQQGGQASAAGGLDPQMLIGIATSLMNNAGGLQGILAKLQQGGLGEAAQSWVGTGANQPVSPDALSGALGPDLMGMITQFTAPSWPMAVVGLAIVVLGQSITFPNLVALISMATPPERQGEVLGLNMSNSALARIGGPILAGQLFSLVSPGAPFALTALLILPAIWLCLQIMRIAPDRRA